MTDTERLERRLAAVERAVVDGDGRIDELADLESALETITELESRLDEHERRIADLEGRTGSLEGFTGEIRAVNDEVERQAASALAAVDRLERRFTDRNGDSSLEHSEDESADANGRNRGSGTASTNASTVEGEGRPASTEDRATSPASLPREPERTAELIVDGSSGEPRNSGENDRRDVVPASQRSVERRLESRAVAEPGQDSSTVPETRDETNTDGDGTGMFAALRSRL